MLGRSHNPHPRQAELESQKWNTISNFNDSVISIDSLPGKTDSLEERRSTLSDQDPIDFLSDEWYESAAKEKQDTINKRASPSFPSSFQQQPPTSLLTRQVRQFSSYLNRVEAQQKQTSTLAAPLLDELALLNTHENNLHAQIKRYAKIMNEATSPYYLPPSIAQLLEQQKRSEAANVENLTHRDVIQKIKESITVNQIIEMKEKMFKGQRGQPTKKQFPK